MLQPLPPPPPKSNMMVHEDRKCNVVVVVVVVNVTVKQIGLVADEIDSFRKSLGKPGNVVGYTILPKHTARLKMSNVTSRV